MLGSQRCKKVDSTDDSAGALPAASWAVIVVLWDGGARASDCRAAQPHAGSGVGLGPLSGTSPAPDATFLGEEHKWHAARSI